MRENSSMRVLRARFSTHCSAAYAAIHSLPRRHLVLEFVVFFLSQRHLHFEPAIFLKNLILLRGVERL